MTVEPINPVLLGAKIGLSAGLFCVAYLLALYLTGPQLLLSPWAIFTFVIIVFFKTVDAYLLWKKRNDHVVFKDALGSLFMVSVVSLLILTVFYYLIFNYYDLSLIEPVKKKIAENAMKSFEEDRITKQALDGALVRIGNIKFSAGMASMVYSLLLFIGFFYSLVFAAVSRLISKDIAVRMNHQ